MHHFVYRIAVGRGVTFSGRGNRGDAAKWVEREASWLMVWLFVDFPMAGRGRVNRRKKTL